MSLSGIRTVAGLELKQRRRTSRWPVVLGVWFMLIGVVTVLTSLTLNSTQVRSGAGLYDVVTFLVLGLGMLVVPSLTATSINGDREHGVLATLQTTLLTPGDIIVGKLLASWAVAGTFLLASAPFLVWAWAAGGISIGRILACLVVLLLVLAVVCAIGLMFSSLTARPVASAVLTYLTVSGLVLGTVVGFALSYFLVLDREQVSVRTVPDSFYSSAPLTEDEAKTYTPPQPTAADCIVVTQTREVGHTERIWWLLPMNPFVVVADAAPAPPPRDTREATGFTPMRWISEGARAAEAGPPKIVDECTAQVGAVAGLSAEPPSPAAPSRAAVWPYGLAFLLALGGGATAVARARLRTPVRRLPAGTRIA